MTLSEVIALYGLDVILLTVANAALAELLKRTLLKNKPKIVTAIIYAAGTVMYIVYESIRMKNALFFIDNASSAIEHGLSVGTLTVLLCAAVDRFFDGGSGTSAEDTIALILKGWVKSGKANDCAKKIIELKASQSGDEFIDGAAELVAEYAADGDELKLVKRKVTRRDVPPDIKAVKMLLDGEAGVAELSDEELEERRQKLIEMLKEEGIDQKDSD